MISAYLCAVCIKDRTLCHALASCYLLQGDIVSCSLVKKERKKKYVIKYQHKSCSQGT
jgi:hypothetical protein